MTKYRFNKYSGIKLNIFQRCKISINVALVQLKSDFNKLNIIKLSKLIPQNKLIRQNALFINKN